MIVFQIFADGTGVAAALAVGVGPVEVGVRATVGVVAGWTLLPPRLV